MTVSVESAATSRCRTEPRRNSPHSASAATHVTRNAIARSPLRSVSASSTFETGASRVYSVGRTRSTSAGGAPLTASTRPGKGERAESKTSAMSVKAIGWRRSRFTRTILGMRVRDATVARLLACCLAAAALACREARRANPRPADAGTMVTVYVPPKAADRIAGRLQTIAAQHQWALSIRTDSAGRAEADWHRAPPGKWTAAQIVHHLAISIEGSGRVFEDRRAKPPMRRRPRPLRQRLRQFVYLDVGWIPSGRRAPAATEPAQRPDPGAVERQLRDGVARFVALAHELLPARRDDLFVKHPAFGDLTLPEWLRFHVRHCAHHAKQIRALLAS